MKLTQRTLHNRAKMADFQYPLINQQLGENMLKFMREQGGIGLAATQIGERVSVFVMEIGSQQWICFNPEIEKLSDDMVEFDEGCLSFPGKSCKLQRPDTIDIRYQDASGNWHWETLTGLSSRCFQHELDHLDGITMWDRYKEQHAEQS
jgi:peptide deformylase